MVLRGFAMLLLLHLAVMPNITSSPTPSTCENSPPAVHSLLTVSSLSVQDGSDLMAHLGHYTDVPEAVRFLEILTDLKTRSAFQQKPSVYESIAIIGGGPASLISALAAVQSGFPPQLVTIHEKRFAYNRDIFFDVASSSINALSKNFDSLGFLTSLGIDQMRDLNATDNLDVDGRGGRILTLPCRGLEIFLAKILIAIGCDFRFGSFQSVSSIPLPPKALLIIADGAKSPSLPALGITPGPSPRVVAAGQDFGQAPSHTTLLVNVRSADNSDICPAYHQHIDPYFPAFHLWETYGVTSVFKRFFHAHCEMQVFFSSDIKKDDVDAERLVHDILDLIIVAEDRAGISIEEQRWFDVSVKRASVVAGTTERGHDFVVAGDSALSAHYRLGIGVNYGIMVAKTYLPRLLDGRIDVAEYNELVNSENVRAEKDMARFVKFEAECNLVLFEREAFRRSWKDKTYKYIEDYEIGDFCEKRQHST